MHRRFRPLVAFIGALVLIGPHTTGVASAAPPELEIEITVDAFDGQHFVGTVVCTAPAAINLSGEFRQEADPLPIIAYGAAVHDAYEVNCGPDPAPYRMEIYRGDGIFAPGAVNYTVSARLDGTSPVLASVEGELTLTESVDVVQPPMPDTGPLPVHIDPEADVSPAAPVITGTVTCPEPLELTMYLSGWQMAGRFQVEFSASDQLPCDGETPFAVPISSDDGGVVPGPATVTVSVGPPLGTPPYYETTRKSAEVQLRSSMPEPDFRPEPQPGTSIRFGQVERVNDHLVASVFTAPCAPGEEWVWVVADIRPASLRTGDHWLNPHRLEEFANAGAHACTGAEQAHLLILPDDYLTDEVVVDVTRTILHRDSDRDYATQNAATLTVSTK